MFTGIVRHVGTVLKEAPNFTVSAPFHKIKKGESVAVNGVCLTALQIKALKGGRGITFELSEETIAKTTLGNLKKGARVNLELPIRAGETFGGHFVLGHVDGVGLIAKISPLKHSKVYSFSYPKALRRELTPKGSIAVDGISLTILNIQDGIFSVSVLPYTENETSLGRKRAGDSVHLETDILAKVVAQNVSILHP